MRARRIRYIAGEPYMTCSKCGVEYPMTKVWFRWVPYRNRLANQCRVCQHLYHAAKWERIKNTPELHETAKANGRRYGQTNLQRLVSKKFRHR